MRKRLQYLFDYYIGYFLYNGYKLHRYHKYMYHTYGDMYCTKEEYDRYLKGDL